MPRRQENSKPKKTKEVFLPLRAVVLSMRLFYHEKFTNIKAKTRVKASTAQHICQQTCETAGSNDFHVQLAVLEHKD